MTRSLTNRAEVLIGPPGWTDQAACRDFAGGAIDLWHDLDAREVNHPQARLIIDARRIEARLICAGCPVRRNCLEYALELTASTGLDGARALHGIFAGLMPGELRHVARAAGRSTRKVARHGTRTMYINQRCRCESCRQANARSEHRRRQELQSA